jgi:hypothetical protein
MLTQNEKIRLGIYSTFGIASVGIAHRVWKNPGSTLKIKHKRMSLFSPNTPIKYKIVF